MFVPLRSDKMKKMRNNTCITLLLVAAVLMTVGSCGSASNDRKPATASETDSLLESVADARQYDRLLTVVDSLYSKRQISEVEANYYRGVAYSYQQQLRKAEAYWQKVVSAQRFNESRDMTSNQQDLKYYYESAASLAGVLANRRNYEGALRVAVPAVTQMEQTGSDMNVVHALLHEAIGRCQMNLSRDKEAEESYGHAYKLYMEHAAASGGADPLRHAIVCVYNTALGYLNAKKYREAQLWTHRGDSLMVAYEREQDHSSTFAGRVKASLLLQHAVELAGVGRKDEAAEAYRSYQATDYGQTDDGRIDATSYLVVAKRYGEAADNYQLLDGVLPRWGMAYSLDNVQGFLFPKFQANVGAGRKDSALAVATQMVERLDSAIAQAKKSDAAELATIYDTQQMETELARQQADMSWQRFVGTVVALLLITAFFVFYILYRRRAQRRLQSTFDELQQAYDQLQQTTEAKERIERELRIARDIQMSMVPSVFPERQGLDLYASMTPAKEVGGDLYDYVLLGHRLYFCVGDVAGKGVPASLVMAQTTRLFRSLATQEVSPAQMANRINKEMTDGNASHGMFVTMFIGLLDLKTGHLLFCNAGHNPPVLTGKDGGAEFLQMESNAPVGLWPELEYVEEELDTIDGRSLFVYTDGLTEAEDPDLQQFGDDRLLNIMSRTMYRDSRKIIGLLQKEVDRHRRGAEPNDDMTMLCLRITI